MERRSEWEYILLDVCVLSIVPRHPFGLYPCVLLSMDRTNVSVNGEKE